MVALVVIEHSWWVDRFFLDYGLLVSVIVVDGALAEGPTKLVDLISRHVVSNCRIRVLQLRIGHLDIIEPLYHIHNMLSATVPIHLVLILNHDCPSVEQLRADEFAI